MMKKITTFLILVPFLANAQAANNSSNFGGLVGQLIGLGIVLLLFLAIRGIILWYFKIDTLVSYQEQNIKALQSIYHGQEELVKLAKEQTKLLREITQNNIKHSNKEK